MIAVTELEVIDRDQQGVIWVEDQAEEDQAEEDQAEEDQVVEVLLVGFQAEGVVQLEEAEEDLVEDDNNFS